VIVRNAEISTATVEIRTVTIGGKQMTLSVFRQVMSTEWLDGAGEQQGQAWGVVNYHGDCGPETSRRHLHVLWQWEDELRKCRLTEPAWPYFYGPTKRTDALVQAIYCASDHGSAALGGTGVRGCYRLSFDGVTCEANRPEDRLSPRYNPGHECSPDVAAAEAELRAELDAERALHARRQAGWLVALRLPQLFIAV
jgi:hypothetical protein